MKKVFFSFAVMAIFMCVSCSNGNTKDATTNENDSVAVNDSVVQDTLIVNTISADSTITE